VHSSSGRWLRHLTNVFPWGVAGQVVFEYPDPHSPQVTRLDHSSQYQGWPSRVTGNIHRSRALHVWKPIGSQCRWWKRSYGCRVRHWLPWLRPDEPFRQHRWPGASYACTAWPANACRGEDTTNDELRFESVQRNALVPILETGLWNIPSDLKNHILSLPLPPNVDPKLLYLASAASALPLLKCMWQYFSISSYFLEALENVTIAQLPGSFTLFIYTDYALFAFILKIVMRTKIVRIQVERIVTFVRAVEAKRAY
jgi:hypothetical protein